MLGLVVALAVVACETARPSGGARDDAETTAAHVRTARGRAAAARPTASVAATVRTTGPGGASATVPALAWVRGPGALAECGEPPDETSRLGFRWTHASFADPCWPPVDHPDARNECATAQAVERMLESNEEVTLTGRPRCFELGCGERPDLVLGYAYPNHSVFLLTPDGARFPDLCPEVDDLPRSLTWRLRARGRFAPRRGIYVMDQCLFPGDHQPCDYLPHPVLIVRDWCLVRGQGNPPRFADHQPIPAERVCGASKGG